MGISEYVMLGIFILSFALILGPNVNRTVAAMLGAVLMMVVGISSGHFTEEEVFTFIHWDVIGLLIGMMIIVVILTESGFFEFLALKITRNYITNRWSLFLHLGLITAILSMIVDNVTTILVMVPVTIAISRQLHINPRPLIIAEVTMSNIGGIGTMVGDPPNLIIAGYSNYNFNDFVFNLMPVVLILLGATLLIYRNIFRGWLERDLKASASDDHWTGRMDPRLMRKIGMVLLGTIFFFLLHPLIGISPAVIALAGGTLALLISGDEPFDILSKVEWPLILFFASLFIIAESLVEIGVIQSVADWIVDASAGNSLLLLILFFWFSFFMSALTDNVPFTAMMAPIILHMSLTLDASLLWWALALGVMLGGNWTPIGTSATIVALGISKRLGQPISTSLWFRRTTPIVIATGFIATAYLALLWYLVG